MKKIKFRVHCGDTGKILAYEHFNTILNWGYYWTDPNEPESEAICHAPAEYFKHPHELGSLNRVLYTGLKDKNGTEIYKGDILEYGEKLMKVIWRDEGADFVVETIETYSSFYAPLFWKHMTVIGNIYENPELISQVDKCP